VAETDAAHWRVRRAGGGSLRRCGGVVSEMAIPRGWRPPHRGQVNSPLHARIECSDTHLPGGR
jgi:hypothetical protein